MNIEEARQEIIRTVKIYNKKDEAGNYLFPEIRQRPLFMIGPPGIGKTAIVAQAAEECGVGMVSYTITHHTRQSAVGLPKIVERDYQGKKMMVTTYTLSEIIASVYDYMERTGKREGILFIDEINCVSETLAPTMLQFLQNKCFGNHKVPRGWIIVSAGNPPEYNKSVREFDIATLDRVRSISVSTDFDIWMSYARERKLSGAILSYLTIKRENFYRIEDKDGERIFVTARGWEDLSEVICGCEDAGFAVEKSLMEEYIHNEEIARDFSSYYKLYQKYGEDYKIPEIAQGIIKNSDEAYLVRTELVQKAAFDEKMSVIGWMLSYLEKRFYEYDREEKLCLRLQELLRLFRPKETENFAESFGKFAADQRRKFEIKRENDLFQKPEELIEQKVLAILDTYTLALKGEHLYGLSLGVDRLKTMFLEITDQRAELAEEISSELKHLMNFAGDAFSESERILLVTGLAKNRLAMRFIAQHGGEEYLNYAAEFMGLEEEERF